MYVLHRQKMQISSPNITKTIKLQILDPKQTTTIKDLKLLGTNEDKYTIDDFLKKKYTI